jgi:AcrR family transcriptional regulator
MQKRSAETHSRILASALELFAQEGYEATGVAEICQAAGVSKGAFYHHFPAKQAIFIELLHTWLDTLDAQMKNIQLNAQDVPQALINMTDLMQAVFLQAGGRLPMFLEFWTQASHDPAVWQTVIAPYRRYHEFFKAILAQGIAEGSLQPYEPNLAAHVVVALAVGLLLQGILDPQDADWSQVPSQSMKLLLDGLARRKNG